MNQVRGRNTVMTLCVALTLSFYAWFTTTVAPAVARATHSGTVVRFGVSLLAAAGVYITLFQSLMWIYVTFLEDRINRRTAICGEWFYRLDIRAAPDNSVYGICEIAKEAGTFTARAIHFDPKTRRFTSRFNSDYVLLDGATLIIVYSSAGMDEDIFTRRGVYFLSTEGVPPRRMYGIWSDFLPSRNSGETIMHRRDRHSDEFLRRLGYPIDSGELERLLATDFPEAKVLHFPAPDPEAVAAVTGEAGPAHEDGEAGPAHETGKPGPAAAPEASQADGAASAR